MALFTFMIAALALSISIANAADQQPDNRERRVFAYDNAMLDIDGVDDYRVDATVAVMDSGIKYDEPDFNVVGGIDCTAVVDLDRDKCDDSPGAGDETDGDNFWHGTLTANLGAIDNDYATEIPWEDRLITAGGGVGVAPGVRLWAVDALSDDFFDLLMLRRHVSERHELEWMDWDLAPAIAAIRWITAAREDQDPSNDIDVLLGGPPNGCTRPGHSQFPRPWPHCSDQGQVDAHDQAIEEMVDAGVVYVAQAAHGDSILGEARYDASTLVATGHPDAIGVSAIGDVDGLPGGLASGDPCNHSVSSYDDVLAGNANFGQAVDIVAPGCATSSAGPPVAAAAAILASIVQPDSREDVEVIRDTLIATGNHDWTDNSGDGKHEPLLDVGCEAVYAPVMVAGTESPSGPEPVEPPESDVNCDGYADLVTLRPDGTVLVHPGKVDGTFDSATVSFSDGRGGGTLDPAQYDGTGHYPLDVADVDANGYADLVTLKDDGDVHVFSGDPDRTFDERGRNHQGTTSGLNLTPALLEAGGHEPIAVADVDGDIYADLIAYDDRADELLVYTGNVDRTFDSATEAASSVTSALHTGAGEYSIDADDVTGDGRADLVSMTSGGTLRVYPGKSDATFDAPVDSHRGQIDPAMDDAEGYEPIGLGDVDGDEKADLALVDDRDMTRVYSGVASGAFGTAAQAWEDPAPTTTFGADPADHSQMAGLLDVSGDGRADLTGVIAGYGFTLKGQTDGRFDDPYLSFDGRFSTTQHSQTDPANHEMVSEKPAWKRRGCHVEGCPPATWAPLPDSLIVPEVKDAASSQQCGTVTVDGPNVSGGCVVEGFRTNSFSFTRYMTCDWIDIGRLHVDGNGTFAAADVTANCSTGGIGAERCDPDPLPQVTRHLLFGAPWTGTFAEVEENGVDLAFLAFCLDTPAGEWTDQLMVAVVDVGGSMYWGYLTASSESVNPESFFRTGTWYQRSGDELDIEWID